MLEISSKEVPQKRSRSVKLDYRAPNTGFEPVFPMPNDDARDSMAEKRWLAALAEGDPKAPDALH